MIPKAMEAFLRQQLPERTWQNRLVRENDMCFMEFGPMDIDRLARLGIEVDRLGPKLVACLWEERPDLEVGGYLVVDNLAMGRPSMGGIRMLPDLTPTNIHNLARGMTLKNAAANLPYGGGKSGIVTDPNWAANAPELHIEIVRRFARLLYRYRDIYLPGPDVGTNDADMKTIAIENGLDNALSKPAEMGGVQIDQLGAAGGGLIIALEALLSEMPRLRSLPQFANLAIPNLEEITILLQGFGSVGAHAGHILHQRLHGAKVTGVSDLKGYLYDPAGLPVDQLFKIWQEQRLVTEPYFRASVLSNPTTTTKYSNWPDDLLREDAFCMIPAAPIAHYLDTDPLTQPTVTVNRMGRWALILEGANTYSPDPARIAVRTRMERAVYRERGVLIVTDYLVNSGGVIFASQEHLIQTPEHLRIPNEMRGDRRAVDHWLAEHAEEMEILAGKRRVAAEAARDEVIRSNMRELVNLLLTDADMLPCEAAEQIGIQRMASRERKRTAADIMERIITIPVSCSVGDAARLLVETVCPILAVLDEQEQLVGVITDWDVTRASAQGIANDLALETTMTREVITASPRDTILELVRKLEYHEISSMPVVEGGKVVGMVSTDLLARRSLYPLLIFQSS